MYPADCDDEDPNAYPGAAFLEVNAAECMKDSDGDGYEIPNVEILRP